MDYEKLTPELVDAAVLLSIQRRQINRIRLTEEVLTKSEEFVDYLRVFTKHAIEEGMQGHGIELTSLLATAFTVGLEIGVELAEMEQSKCSRPN